MSTAYSFTANGVRFSGSGVWPYSVHVRRPGRSTAVVWKWEGLSSFALPASADRAFHEAIVKCPHSHVYAVRHRDAAIIVEHIPIGFDDIAEPEGVEE